MTLKDLQNTWKFDVDVCVTANAYERETLDYYSFRSIVERGSLHDIKEEHILTEEIETMWYSETEHCLFIFTREYIG